MKKRKLLAALALTLALCLLPATMLAKEWDLANGSVTVTRDEDGKQLVKQGDQEKEDEDPVLTGKGAVGTVVKLMAVDEGGTINVTLKDAKFMNDGSALVVGDGTDATVKLEGYNVIGNSGKEEEAKKQAALHIASGSLTLTTDEVDDTTPAGRLVVSNYGNAAAIGSDAGQDCAAVIHITDHPWMFVEEIGEVSVKNPGGAAIGSGAWGDFTGRIVIDGSAVVVTRTFTGGANLGSGGFGEFDGDIEITDDAKVLIENMAIDNAGFIGMGANEDDEVSSQCSGTITLGGNAILSSPRVIMLGSFVGQPVPGVKVTIGENVQFTDENGIPYENPEERVFITGTLDGVTGEPAQPAEVYYAQGEAFRVVDEDGNAVAYDKTLVGGVLTIKAPKGAKLIGALEEMQRLYNEGATELRFGSSVLPLAELYHGVGMQGDTVELTQNGKLTIGGEDYSALLK